MISIHALLTESDAGAISQLQCVLGNFYPRSPYGERRAISQLQCVLGNFYPRSPYGERPMMPSMAVILILFLSTLSLRRATPTTGWHNKNNVFLSTLSLRRATIIQKITVLTVTISIHALLTESDIFLVAPGYKSFHFYPRSPYGERRANNRMAQQKQHISIHALLTESDNDSTRQTYQQDEFLSTLSLRRATI